MITIDLRRDDPDGNQHVTRMQGTAGMAIAIETTDLDQFTVDPDVAQAVMMLQGKNMPVCSIRASNAMELALMVAGVVATADHTHPGILPLALRLAGLMDCDNPMMYREDEDL